jgi:hypothetical protein
MTRRSVPRFTILACLLGVVLLVPLLAACEETPTVHKVIPTQALRFHFDITGMYSNDLLFVASDPDVHMDVHVDILSGGSTALDGGERLTCDGQTDPAEKRPWRSLTFRLPRRSPGEFYRCVYTNEVGAATQLAVPVPFGNLAFTSPEAHAHLLPLGEGARLAIRYIFPLPPGYVPPSTTTNATLTPSPDGPSATVHVAAGCGTLGNNACSDATGRSEPATGSYTLLGSGTAIQGPGFLILNLQMHWQLPAENVAGADIQTTDSAKLSIYFWHPN